LQATTDTSAAILNIRAVAYQHWWHRTVGVRGAVDISRQRTQRC
jgi:hypothetical protein